MISALFSPRILYCISYGSQWNSLDGEKSVEFYAEVLRLSFMVNLCDLCFFVNDVGLYFVRFAMELYRWLNIC